MVKDLKGHLSVKLFDHLNLEDLVVKHVPTYDRDRFEIVAIRVFASAEFVVTVFAADRLSKKNVGAEKYAVKKFKIETLSMAELFAFVEAFNLTISDADYELYEMAVTNK